MGAFYFLNMKIEVPARVYCKRGGHSVTARAGEPTKSGDAAGLTTKALDLEA